jgi:hypothetical protein
VSGNRLSSRRLPRACSTGRGWIAPAGRAASPSARRRRRAGRASGGAARAACGEKFDGRRMSSKKVMMLAEIYNSRFERGGYHQIRPVAGLPPSAPGQKALRVLVVEALGRAPVPTAGCQPDHRAGVELAMFDAHCAAEAAAEVERRLDDGGGREVLRDRFEIVTSRGGRRECKVLNSMPTRGLPLPFRRSHRSNGRDLRDNPVPAHLWLELALASKPTSTRQIGFPFSFNRRGSDGLLPQSSFGFGL